MTAVSSSLIVYRLLLSSNFLFCPLLSYSGVYAYSRLFSLIIHWRIVLYFATFLQFSLILSLFFINLLTPRCLEIMPPLIVKPCLFFSETHQMPPLFSFQYTCNCTLKARLKHLKARLPFLPGYHQMSRYT